MSSNFFASYSSGSGGGGGSGTVTSVSVVSAHGLAGTVANATTTPAITLSTTITGILQGDGTSISAATTGNLTDTGTDGITVGSGTGAVLGSGTTISQHVADTTHNGYLASTDWNTFNGKQAALTIGNLTDVGTDGITVTGGTGAVIGSGTSIAQAAAGASQNGYLKSTDWSTFNGKGSGTVTSVSSSGATGLTLTTTNGTTTPAIALGGTLTIAGGGSGQTSASAAFNALSPMTTAGDVIYGGASGAGTRLAAGTSSQVFVGGTTPSWGNVPAAALPIVVPGTSAGAVSSSGVTGNTTGNAIASGYVGEVVKATFSMYDLTGSEAVVTGSSITVGAGVWRLYYSVSMNVTAAAATGDGVTAAVLITTGGSQVGTSIRSFYVYNNAAAVLGLINTLTAEEIVNPSGSTTYSLSAANLSTTGASSSFIAATSNTSYASTFYAVRIA